jgi:hypothetical protein
MNKKLILIIGLVIIAGVGYGIFTSSRSTPEDTTSTRQVVGADGVSSPDNTEDVTGEAGRLFVTQLLAIQSINFNLNFFNDPVFRNLQDFSQVIEKQPIGRPNPFAPIGDFGSPVSAVNGPVTSTNGSSVVSIGSGATTTTAQTTTGSSNTTSNTPARTTAPRVITPARTTTSAPSAPSPASVNVPTEDLNLDE